MGSFIIRKDGLELESDGQYPLVVTKSSWDLKEEEQIDRLRTMKENEKKKQLKALAERRIKMMMMLKRSSVTRKVTDEELDKLNEKDIKPASSSTQQKKDENAPKTTDSYGRVLYIHKVP